MQMTLGRFTHRTKKEGDRSEKSSRTWLMNRTRVPRPVDLLRKGAGKLICALEILARRESAGGAIGSGSDKVQL
jgi:hypothetical protein